MTTTSLTPTTKAHHLTIDGDLCKETKSQALARAATDGTINALTLQAFADCGDELDSADLVAAMKRAGDEATAGDLQRTERMLATQLLTLDAMFNHLARRAASQTQYKGLEILTRLALKAQAQARATAETLGVLKNPMPYIKQTNIAQGPQQVNNGIPPTGTRKNKTVPIKQLEQPHNGERMDFGTATTASRGNTDMEAVGAVNRPNKRRGQGKGGA